MGQGRNHSDRFVTIFMKSLLEAAEWIEVLKQAMWKRCQRAESGKWQVCRPFLHCSHTVMFPQCDILLWKMKKIYIWILNNCFVNTSAQMKSWKKETVIYLVQLFIIFLDIFFQNAYFRKDFVKNRHWKMPASYPHPAAYSVVLSGCIFSALRKVC